MGETRERFSPEPSAPTRSTTTMHPVKACPRVSPCNASAAAAAVAAQGFFASRASRSSAEVSGRNDDDEHCCPAAPRLLWRASTSSSSSSSRSSSRRLRPPVGYSDPAMTVGELVEAMADPRVAGAIFIDTSTTTSVTTPPLQSKAAAAPQQQKSAAYVRSLHRKPKDSIILSKARLEKERLVRRASSS